MVKIAACNSSMEVPSGKNFSSNAMPAFSALRRWLWIQRSTEEFSPILIETSLGGQPLF
jgi:hypothetical protein